MCGLNVLLYIKEQYFRESAIDKTDLSIITCIYVGFIFQSVYIYFIDWKTGSLAKVTEIAVCIGRARSETQTS